MKKTNNQIHKSVRRNSKTVTAIQTPKTTYRAITHNVYFDGYSYRARVMVNGVMNSRNFSSQRKAITWRNEQKRVVR
jgi:hypothetical protein